MLQRCHIKQTARSIGYFLKNFEYFFSPRFCYILTRPHVWYGGYLVRWQCVSTLDHPLWISYLIFFSLKKSSLFPLESKLSIDAWLLRIFQNVWTSWLSISLTRNLLTFSFLVIGNGPEIANSEFLKYGNHFMKSLSLRSFLQCVDGSGHVAWNWGGLRLLA